MMTMKATPPEVTWPGAVAPEVKLMNTKPLIALSIIPPEVTPPCSKWAWSFFQLLADSDGVEVFAKFLRREKLEDALHFYFAVKGRGGAWG